MKTLKNYIIKAFLYTFLSSVVVFTFVASIGALFKITDLIIKGIPAAPVFKVFISGMPQALAFAIPISAITATLLVFGRLSADSEITAMRACGISLWQITRWMMPIAFLLMLVCLFIISELEPRGNFIRRATISELGAVNPVDMIEEGRTISEFDGLSLYVERKKGDTLLGIRIFDQREEGKTRVIKAARGVVTMPTNSTAIVLSLEEVTLDPFSFDLPGKANAARWSVQIADSQLSTTNYRRRIKDMSLIELLMNARRTREEEAKLTPAVLQSTTASQEPDLEVGPQQEQLLVDAPEPDPELETKRAELRVEGMKIMVEFHKRLALAGACFAFVFVGIPLGIRSHRKESSLGVGLALVLVYSFYMFILIAKQLTPFTAWHPDLMNWFPVILYLLLGTFMIRRLN